MILCLQIAENLLSMHVISVNAITATMLEVYAYVKLIQEHNSMSYNV